jgi:hypothetical protein
VDLSQQIATGGTFGLILALLVAVYGYSTGRVRVGSVVDADRKEEATRRDTNEAILRAERNEAIKLAQSYADEFERALDIIEGQQKPKP